MRLFTLVLCLIFSFATYGMEEEAVITYKGGPLARPNLDIAGEKVFMHFEPGATTTHENPCKLTLTNVEAVMQFHIKKDQKPGIFMYGLNSPSQFKAQYSGEHKIDQEYALNDSKKNNFADRILEFYISDDTPVEIFLKNCNGGSKLITGLPENNDSPVKFEFEDTNQVRYSHWKD